MRAPTAAELHALKCELAGEVLRSSGGLRLRVTGWSMLPTIFPGDTLLIERTASESVGKGDVVLFHRDRRLFVHRVSRKRGNARDPQIITQGDGMLRPDPPLSGSQLLGKVCFVERDGWCLEPPKNLGLRGRAIAVLVRRSTSAARVIVGLHKMARKPREPHPCQS
ncbi:MAG TPA: S24/S26 family peptidase [Candidatus Sulfotelmatobacter sp.]|nr:S24/S26 family peptidase [Candidatus Sulfotelmatobacter sp.]